jgi:hypothetical protein
VTRWYSWKWKDIRQWQYWTIAIWIHHNHFLFQSINLILKKYVKPICIHWYLKCIQGAYDGSALWNLRSIEFLHDTHIGKEMKKFNKTETTIGSVIVYEMPYLLFLSRSTFEFLHYELVHINTVKLHRA